LVNENLKKPFLKLSGGMKQKLLVAFALGRNPKILLMDEPSANLDPKAREVFFDYLKNFDKDTLMILSSHRISEISALVNRAVEMDLGEVVSDKIISS
jgi:ABC-2 type transport system ATP-binding protein